MAVSPNFAQELGAIDFGKVIGAPLMAAVDAHNEAQIAVARFIRQIGFTTDAGGRTTANMVTFEYARKVEGPAEPPTDPAAPPPSEPVAAEKRFRFEVPLLLMMNLPYFEVDSVDVALSVQLTSVETRRVDETLGVNASLAVKHGWPMGHVNFKVNASYKRTTRSGSRVERKYEYEVRVHAGAAEPPEGVSRLLDALTALAVEKEA